MVSGYKVSKHVQKILTFFSQNKKSIRRLLILTHDNPDPDSLASAFALRYLAKNAFGISAKIAYGGVVGRMENRRMVEILKIPAHLLKASDLKKYRHIALVDTQPFFQNNSFPDNRRASLVIDQHHAALKPDADLTVLDPACGATCVLIAEALLAMKMKIPTRIATAIAYGILSETLGLHRGTTSRVIKVHLKLLPLCDMRAIASIQNPVRSRNFFMTLSHGIRNARVLRRLVVSHLKEVENPDLVAQVADFLLTYRGMHWSLCTGRYQRKLHFSLRTNHPKAEAGRILRYVLKRNARAGGHGTIAGGSFEMGDDLNDKRWRTIENLFTRRLVQRLHLPEKEKFQFEFQ